MIARLETLGLSQQAIADKVQCSQPTVHRISKGADPRYALGCRIEKLLEIYEKQEPKAA